MLVINCQPGQKLNRSERAMRRALGNSTGVLLVNALVTTGRRHREIDGIWLHPTDGIRTIEMKGTPQAGTLYAHLNGAWMVDEQEAQFAGGPNPVQQARQGAQVLQQAFIRGNINPGYVESIVGVSAEHLSLAPSELQVATVVLAANLPDLAAPTEGRALGVGDVLATLNIIDVAKAQYPTVPQLSQEGFPPGKLLTAPGTRTPGSPSKTDNGAGSAPKAHQKAEKARRSDIRKYRKLERMHKAAHREWNISNTRRLVASVVAAVPAVLLTVKVPTYCAIIGLIATVFVAMSQLRQRRTTAGDRATGTRACALWLLTLTPFYGLGTSLAWLSASPYLGEEIRAVIAMLSIIAAAGMWVAISSGRSKFIHPPRLPLEKLNDRGNSVGAYILTTEGRYDIDAHEHWEPVSLEEIEQAREALAAGEQQLSVDNEARAEAHA